MKKIFSLLVFLMCLFSKGTLAEEIKYGRFVTYDGKVDASKNPEGKGKLITEYKVERMTEYGTKKEVNKDVLQGKFSQGKVVDAKVQFARYNGPLWLNTATFKGELDYEILDNNSVKYTLLEGTFTSSDHCDYTISRDNPLVITRIPSFEGCETKSEPLCYKTKGGNIQSSNYSRFYQSIGEIKEVYQVQEYVLNNQWELRKGEITPKPVYADGTKVTIYDQYDFDIEYANGDFLRKKEGEELVLRKTCPDGVLDYNIVKKEASIAYADGANYKGTVDVKVLYNISPYVNILESYSLDRIINDVMKAPSLESMKICLVTGVLVKNGENIEYKNGLTLAEIEELNRKAEEERKAEEQRQAAAMKAKADAAKNKNQAIKVICEKAYSYPNMKVNIDGLILKGTANPLKGLEKAVAVLKTYDFGAQGKTMALYVYIKYDESTVQAMCFSTSGKNVKLIEHRENGGIVYGPNLKFPIALVKVPVNGNTSWSANVSGGNITTSCYEGMTEDEFLLEFKNSMMPLKLIESNGDTKVYQLVGAKMDKKYYWYGEDDYNYQLGSKETGRFYFKNNKLTKWFLDL